MNVLKLFLDATWGQKGDKISLARLREGLGRLNASRDAKDFHASDDFFRTVVKSFILSLCMHGAGCDTIDSFKTWLLTNDWPKMVHTMEKTCLGAFKSTELYSAAAEASRDNILADIARDKQAWQDKKEQDCVAGIRSGRPPNWDKIEQERIKAGTAVERDVVRENAILLVNLGLLYLDFVDACRGGYSGRVEKCIQCFAVIFQGSSAKNYAGECLHLVACLKKIWKPEFRYVPATAFA